MTLFKPHLAVKRLRVRRDQHVAYEADFHPGINIISGENSSGKSTLLDFIFYGLGGDLTSWREAAATCSEVTLEVTLNGRDAVLQREISTSSSQPMRILLDPRGTDSAPERVWGLYPYRRSQHRESFTQVLFRLLGMPEATGDATSNITMHQMLRLLYADQLSPVDRIFRFERFDTALTRQTVGDLLCGGYNDDVYRAQLRLREAAKEHEEITGQWKNAIAAFEGFDHALTMEWVETERASLKDQLAEVQRSAEELEKWIFQAEVSDGLTLEEQEKSYAELMSVQQRLGEERAARDALNLEIADSNRFIRSLEAKLDQLRDSATTAEAVGAVTFIYCPACYAALDAQQSTHSCTLCKSPFDRGRAQSRILSLINETGVQLRQSRNLQRERIQEAQRFDSAISELTISWNTLSERYRLLNRLPSTELRSTARQVYQRAGYLEREIEDLARKQAQVEHIQSLSSSRLILSAEIDALKEKIEVGLRHQKARLELSYTRISENGAKFLRADLARQDVFARAQYIDFDFGDDHISVDGERFFSASSMVYLRNSFYSGFFEAAIQDSGLRHPRFMLLDTVEDKGMEPERSHHFQDLLHTMSRNSKVDHQIIYATAMISPQLADSELIVGRRYTHNSRSLDLD